MRHSLFVVVAVLGMLLISLAGATADLRHGAAVAYSDGARKVIDYFDSMSGVEASGIPIGLAYRFVWAKESGFRMDFSGGPAVVTFGDLSYFNFPISATAGWDFSPDADTCPYVRGGVAVHFASGDYLEDSSAIGGLVAVGTWIKKQNTLSFFVEVSYDTAELGFEDGYLTEYIKPQGFNLSFGVVF